jgi:hypothetical protein
MLAAATAPPRALSLLPPARRDYFNQPWPRPVGAGRPAEAGLARPPGPTRLASSPGLNSGTAFAALRSEPWRPTEGNLERICDIRRPLTWHPLVSAGAQPVSQPPTPVGRAPAGDSTIMRSRCPNSEQPLLGREPYQRPCVGRGETGVLTEILGSWHWHGKPTFALDSRSSLHRKR